MKIIVANDVHLSDKPPRWRTETYPQDILLKLEEIVELANYHQATLVFSGDVFHYPAPGKTTHWLVAQVLDILNKASSPIYIVPGNHDLAGGRLDALPRAPLAVILKQPNINLLTWDQWDEDLSVMGMPWHYDMTASSFKAYVQDIGRGSKPDLVIAHAPISQFDLPYDIVRASDIAGSARAIVYGHMHTPEEPYVIGDTLFFNPGAVSRGSLTDDNINRTPQVLLFDTRGLHPWQYIQLKAARPAEEVFRIAIAEANKETESNVNEFVQKLEEQTITQVTYEDLLDRVSKSDVDPGVIKEATTILESVQR